MSELASDAVLAAESVVAGYLPEVDILNGCDLHVARGEIVGVVGPNGAGKSTLVKAVFGLLPVRSGTISLDGADITGKPAHELVSAGRGRPAARSAATRSRSPGPRSRGRFRRVRGRGYRPGRPVRRRSRRSRP